MPVPEEVIAKLRAWADDEDRRASEVDIPSFNQGWSGGAGYAFRKAAAEIEAVLRADVPQLQQDETKGQSRGVDTQYAAPLATASDGQPIPPNDDWRRFCVNHEGYSGPASVCPACTRRRNGH